MTRRPPQSAAAVLATTTMMILLLFTAADASFVWTPTKRAVAGRRSLRSRNSCLLRSASSPPPRPHPAEDATTAATPLSPLSLHHASLRTRNITAAIQFYGLLGYDVEARFRAGPARAAWLSLGVGGARLELIEVPGYLLLPASPPPPPTGSGNDRRAAPPPRAPDLMVRPAALGYHHVSMDATTQIRALVGENNATAGGDGAALADWLEALNATSLRQFRKTVRLALAPYTQLIGPTVYELAFVYDADGCLVELLHRVGERQTGQFAQETSDMESGWQPWDGKGFVGPDK